MTSIERIYNKLNQAPSKKESLKKALITGFNLSRQDSSNIKIMLKRMGVRYTTKHSNNQLLRLYLNAQYKEQVKLQELSKKKKKAEELAASKIQRMLKVMEQSRVKPNKTSMGSHYVKLVK